MEKIEMQGPDGTPVMVDVTDAALSTLGREKAVADAAAQHSKSTTRARAEERET